MDSRFRGNDGVGHGIPAHAKAIFLLRQHLIPAFTGMTAPTPVIPAKAGIHIQPTTSENKSRQSELVVSTSWIFHSRFHLFNCFSRKDRRLGFVVNLVPDQPIDSVPCSESLDHLLSMLHNPLDQVGRDAYVQRATLRAGEDIHAELLFHRTWIPAFAGMTGVNAACSVRLSSKRIHRSIYLDI